MSANRQFEVLCISEYLSVKYDFTQTGSTVHSQVYTEGIKNVNEIKWLKLLSVSIKKLAKGKILRQKSSIGHNVHRQQLDQS